MKHILITGGAGFIGCHLARQAVDAGHSVRILDNLSPQIHGSGGQFQAPLAVQFFHGDVCDRSDLERALQGIDTVVHLAAETGTGQSMYEIERYYRVNVQGTALLFDILASGKFQITSMVLASSRSVYGEGAYLCRTCESAGRRCFPRPRTPQQLAAHDWSLRCPTCDGVIEPIATREDDRLAPASIYAATKLAQEDLVRVACSSLGIPSAILRLQNVFGEGQSLKNPYTGILSIFSTRIRLGLPLPIFEDGNETRDFVHVADVASAIMRRCEHPDEGGVTLNIGSGEPVSIITMAKLLCRTMGSKIEPQITGQYRIGDIRHNFADISRAQHVLGFAPAVPITKGVERFCDWVLSQPLEQDLLEEANSELESRRLMG